MGHLHTRQVYNFASMTVPHSNTNRLALHRKINRRHDALVKFLGEHPQTRSSPWADSENLEHQQLLERWRDAVNELEEYEHPTFELGKQTY
jgi:hypothetical protein